MSERVYLNIPPRTLEVLDLQRGAYSLCHRTGLEIHTLWRSSDPDIQDASKGETIETREHPLTHADLVIVYIDKRYWEVVEDLRDAAERRKDIIVIYEKGMEIDGLLRGIPCVVEVIEFSNVEDALPEVEIAILKWQWNFVVGHKQMSVLSS